MRKKIRARPVWHSRLQSFRFEDRIRKEFPNLKLKFVCLKEETRGAAETLLKGIETGLSSGQNEPILSLDADNIYNKKLVRTFESHPDNTVFYFEDHGTNPRFSYMSIQDGKLFEIVEKKKISDYASSGAYGFDSIKTLQAGCQRLLESSLQT